MNIPKDLSTTSASELNKIADHYGRMFAQIDKVKTNQVRNVFSSINGIRTNFKIQRIFNDEIETEIVLLKPMMAYAAGRQKALMNFKDFMFSTIDAVLNSANKTKAIESFFHLIEAVVAYHKFYGGKEN